MSYAGYSTNFGGADESYSHYLYRYQEGENNPVIFDSIDRLYSQIQNYSKEDCKGLIRDNVARLINTILDSCFKTESEREFLLIYLMVERVGLPLIEVG